MFHEFIQLVVALARLLNHFQPTFELVIRVETHSDSCRLERIFLDEDIGVLVISVAKHYLRLFQIYLDFVVLICFVILIGKVPILNNSISSHPCIFSLQDYISFYCEAVEVVKRFI